MRIVVASNIDNFANAIKNKGYNVVENVRSTNELQRKFGSTESIADILLITEKIEINGSLVNVVLDIHKHFPKLRIIFLATGDLTNRFTVNQLNTLANAGIYDLFYGSSVTIDKICELIQNPKLPVDCAEIFDAYKKLSNDAENQTFVLENARIAEDTIKNNVVSVTSAKPGTGKSFVSSNLAVTLARYGKKENGDLPKVLLLEGDIQTLNVTRIFNLKDDEYNLKTALNKIDAFMERNDYNINAWFEGASEEKSFIRRCCLRVPRLDNLYILEGHDFDFEDNVNCDGAAFYYLAEYLSSQFDIVVIDSNSSLQHPTTDPIIQLSKTLYFVFTTDFDNIKLNIRFQEEIQKLGIEDKVKYVLNRALVGEQKETFNFKYSDEDVIGIKIKDYFKIPNIDTAIMNNIAYRGYPITLDERELALAVRTSFLKLANDVMPLRFPDDIDKMYKDMKKRFKK